MAEAAVRVYPRDGKKNCAGTPRVCQPVADLITRSDPKGVSATRDPMFVTSHSPLGSFGGSLSAFDARLDQNCIGVPKRCTPLWTTFLYTEDFAAPAIANGRIAVGGTNPGPMLNPACVCSVSPPRDVNRPIDVRRD